MAPSSIFFKKNDSYRDLIQDLQWQVFSYCPSFQDMASLFERLQAQSTYPHRLQQFSLLHGYKKPKLQTSLLGPKGFLISLSNQLLLGQGKCSCKYIIMIFAVESK